MKHVNFMLIAASAVVILTGCSKKEQELPKSLTALTQASAVSADAMRQVYNELSPEDKYALWTQHFRYWADSLGESPEKVRLIEKLSDALSIETFTDDSDAQIAFLNYTAPLWVEEARSVFDDETIFELTMTNKFIGEQPNTDQGGEERPDCFCHAGNSGYSCKKLIISAHPSIEYGICEDPDSCKKTPHGCGFLWYESCSGSHCNF